MPNTKSLKEKFEKQDFVVSGWIDQYSSVVWQFIESEIITPYEKQLEQVERRFKRRCVFITGTKKRCDNWFYLDEAHVKHYPDHCAEHAAYYES